MSQAMLAMPAPKERQVVSLDPMQKTVVSALEFIESYNLSNVVLPDHGLEYLVFHTKLWEKSIRDYVTADESFKYTIPKMQSYRFRSRIPRSIHGLNALEEQELNLPMNFLSEGFDKLSVLSTIVQISGCISQQYLGCYQTRKIAFPGSERVTKALAGFPNIPYDAEMSGIFRINDAQIGRVLSQLGVQIGGEKIDGLHLPPHLLNLSKWYSSGETAHINEARELLLDAVASLFFSSWKQNKGHLRFPAQYSESSAKQFGNEVVYLLNSVFPEDSFKVKTPDRLSRDLEMPNVKLYTPTIYFSRATFRKVFSQL